MKRIMLGSLCTMLFAVGFAAVVVSLGLIPFAADEPHSGFVGSLIIFAKERFLARAALMVTTPDDLASPERIRRGAGNYDAMCAACHLVPEAVDTEIRKGLYPQPPNLCLKGGDKFFEDADARRFQIIKHGVKASGMPAWSKGGMDDSAIWDLVAFLRVLPGISRAGYQSLVDASEGHTHAGLEASEHGHLAHNHGSAPHEHTGYGHHGH